VVNAYREIECPRKMGNAMERRMIASRAFPSGKICQVVVTRHYFADAFPQAGEFLDSFDDHVNGTHIC